MGREQSARRTAKTPQATEGLLTVRQVADNWQVSQRTIRRMIAECRRRLSPMGRQ